MTASGTAGHGAELAAYLDLGVARRGGREVAVGRAVARQPRAAGARDDRGDAQQRRPAGPRRRGVAGATTCPRCSPPAPGSSRASGAARSTTTSGRPTLLRRRAGRGRRGRGQPVVPQPRGAAPTCSPTRRRPPRTRWPPPRGAAGRAGRSSARTSPTSSTIADAAAARAAPRRSRWSTPCSAWPSTSRPAATGSANRRRRAVRARPSTRSRCGPCTMSTGAPGAADRGRRRRLERGDAVELLLAGACAVQVGTATFADPAASARVLTELGDWCRRHGVQALAEVIGGIT